jgi:hypothetical protein
MKKFIILFFVLIQFEFLFCQEIVWPVDVEIYIIVTGLDNGYVGFRMTAQSSVWEQISVPQSWDFIGPTSLYNVVYYPGYLQTMSNTPIPWNSSNTKGFNIKGGSNSWHQPSIGHGLYKFEIYDACFEFFPYHFYLDYKDCDYPARTRPDGTLSPYSGCLGGNDIWILYNATTVKCSLSINSTNWVEIPNSAYLNYWTIKNKNPLIPYTNYFPNYWSNSLSLISTTNNHPRLIWGPHPTYSATNYKIYRAVSNYPVNPASLNYTLVQTINSSTFEFTDNAVTILPGYQYAYYYVVGWNGTSESAKTNYVGTPAEFHKVQAPESNNEAPKEFALYQNYPNPFNPSTKISWQSPVGSWQTLKIYDVLGKEVATLVNEFKPAGNYEVEFDATGLSSGVYFYTLRANDFEYSKSMILMK